MTVRYNVPVYVDIDDEGEVMRVVLDKSYLGDPDCVFDDDGEITGSEADAMKKIAQAHMADYNDMEIEVWP